MGVFWRFSGCNTARFLLGLIFFIICFFFSSSWCRFFVCVGASQRASVSQGNKLMITSASTDRASLSTVCVCVCVSVIMVPAPREIRTRYEHGCFYSSLHCSVSWSVTVSCQLSQAWGGTLANSSLTSTWSEMSVDNILQRESHSRTAVMELLAHVLLACVS